MFPEPLLPLLLASPVFLACAWTDLRGMRIPNRLVIVAAVIFALSALLLGWEATLWRLAGGMVAFAVCFVLFAGRIIGGGDAKLFPVLILFVPPQVYAEFLLIFSFSMAVCMAVLLPVRRLDAVANSGWKGLRPDGRFPMGTAFALATAGFLLLAIFAV